MDRTSIVIGGLLVLLGVGAFAGTGYEHYTALIPAAVGIVLALLGVIVLAKPGARKHAMHAAAAVALLGFLASGGRLVTGLTRGHPTNAALLSQVGMAVLCLLFVVLAIRSFRAARLAREARREA